MLLPGFPCHCEDPRPFLCSSSSKNDSARAPDCSPCSSVLLQASSHLHLPSVSYLVTNVLKAQISPQHPIQSSRLTVPISWVPVPLPLPLEPPLCFYCSAAHPLPVLHFFFNTLIPPGIGVLQGRLPGAFLSTIIFLSLVTQVVAPCIVPKAATTHRYSATYDCSKPYFTHAFTMS